MSRYVGLKRLLDVCAGSLGLIVLSPIIAVVGALVASKLGRPVIFSQSRPGLNGETFRLHKFRTMKIVDPANGLVTDQQRLTRFGRILRSTSLDELPTLINVVRGDMSFVGPRPLLPQYLERYSEEQARRHEVRPGVTGLAQVSGRNSISWDLKFRLDVQYVDTYGFKLDALILRRTLFSVIRREGISADGHVTAEEFVGRRDEASE